MEEDGEALDVGVLDAAARADLLRVLESDSRVRADVIRQPSRAGAPVTDVRASPPCRARSHDPWYSWLGERERRVLWWSEVVQALPPRWRSTILA
jgi:hypothetical protein